MAVNAPMIQYREEFIQKFEQNKALLRETVTTEAMIKGLQATFLTSGSSGAAVTRGINGAIPYRGGNLDQYTATLAEKHAPVERTGFNIFQSQGDARKMMYADCNASINQDVDDVIVDELNTGTNILTVAQTASLDLVTKIKGILGNNSVPFDNNLTALVTPAFFGEISKVKEFGNAQYISGKPLENGKPAWNDEMQIYIWQGFKWIVHPNLPGKQTAAEKCFFYHKRCIGHAVSNQDIQFMAGYDEKQDSSWARATVYHGAKLMQNSGLIIATHDGTGYTVS